MLHSCDYVLVTEMIDKLVIYILSQNGDGDMFY